MPVTKQMIPRARQLLRLRWLLPLSPFGCAYSGNRRAAGNFTQCSGGTAELDTWHHLAVSRDSAGTQRFFVDGVLQATELNAPTPADSSEPFTFGRSGSYQIGYFGGLLDEIRISEAAIYTTPFSPPTTALSSRADTVGLWHFDEGSGQTTADSSGHDRHGTLGNSSEVDTADPIWSTDSPVGGAETPLPPVAQFSAAPLTGSAPLTVTFTDGSSGEVLTRTWTFGDGSEQVTTALTTSHIYTTAGSYTVTLTVAGFDGTDTLTYTNYLTVTPALAAGFYAFPLGGTAPLSVLFFDESSSNPTSYLWDFGDGITSTQSSPPTPTPCPGSTPSPRP